MTPQNSAQEPAQGGMGGGVVPTLTEAQEKALAWLPGDGSDVEDDDTTPAGIEALRDLGLAVLETDADGRWYWRASSLGLALKRGRQR
ncbi:hypothetical protein [Roseomonas chloroacetimidivorans]|uniref:hypothetical protein n=1 Tax=Roseomonas chloroacetimidivorans TaxID=1766656 RepID=UPI003C72A65A